MKREIIGLLVTVLFLFLIPFSGFSQNTRQPESVRGDRYFQNSQPQWNNPYEKTVNGGEIIIRPTFKNSNAYDYSKPATVIKNGEMYQTHPYSTARDYSKPSYRIERRD